MACRYPIPWGGTERGKQPQVTKVAQRDGITPERRHSRGILGASVSHHGTFKLHHDPKGPCGKGKCLKGSLDWDGLLEGDGIVVWVSQLPRRPLVFLINRFRRKN